MARFIQTTELTEALFDLPARTTRREHGDSVIFDRESLAPSRKFVARQYARRAAAANGTGSETLELAE
jgi:hypothetical protein